MRDVNYPKILFPRPPEYLEEYSSGFIVQDGSRFIQDEDFRIQGEGLGDLHHLLLGDAQSPDRFCRINPHGQTVQKFECLRPHTFAIHHAEGGNGIVAQKDILLRTEMWSERELLMNNDDTMGNSFPG